MVKRRIIQADRTLKVCSCGNDVFRCSTKSKITHKELLKTTGFKEYGITYYLRICDKCGKREEINPIKWHVLNRGGKL